MPLKKRVQREQCKQKKTKEIPRSICLSKLSTKGRQSILWMIEKKKINRTIKQVSLKKSQEQVSSKQSCYSSSMGMKEGKQTGLSHQMWMFVVLKFHLFCSGLNTQLSVWRIHKVELSFAIESEAEAVERYEMWIPEDNTCEVSRNKSIKMLSDLFRTVHC